MLVPAMQSIGTRNSSRTFSTPMWAPPRAPPPASARATRGRPGAADVPACCAGTAASFGGIPVSCAATPAASAVTTPIRRLRWITRAANCGDIVSVYNHTVRLPWDSGPTAAPDSRVRAERGELRLDSRAAILANPTQRRTVEVARQFIAPLRGDGVTGHLVGCV